jgi:hypothetical protein
MELSKAKESFNNPRLKKLVNTYQFTTKNGRNTPGFGDYMLSNFFLLQLCNVLGLEFDINFKNHPISKYMITTNQEDKNVDYSDITYPDCAEHIYIINHGLTDFINLLNSIDSEIYYLFTNGWPILNIRKPGIEIIKSKLICGDVLNSHLNRFMNVLGLKDREFITIHMRFSDDLFYKKQINRDTLNKFVNIIRIISKRNNSEKILILSNSNVVKFSLRKFNMSNICFKMGKTVHLGGDNIGHKVAMDDDGVLDTLKDYFVMSKSKRIISVSEYDWGSCFCNSCSKIYSIPLRKIYIN